MVAGCGMGNLCTRPLPDYEARSVGELAARLVCGLGDRTRVGDLEKIIEDSCAREFWFWWRMSDVDNKALFQYLVLSTWLDKAETRGLELDILVQIRDRWFSDPDCVESGIPFQDIHSSVHRVFVLLQSVLSPVQGVVVGGHIKELKLVLSQLREDPVIREELDPLYKVFLKEMSESRVRRVENCLLSIL